MIPKDFNPHGNFFFSYDEYKNNPRSKQSLRVRCLNCGREYLIAPNELERKYKEWRKRCEERGEEQPFSAFRFCSKECARDASPKHQTVELVCSHCGKRFTRRKDVAGINTKSGEVFCSKACHAAWRKANNVAKGDKFVADISQNPNGNFLFTQEEYEATLFPQSRYKKLLPIRCLTCGETFMASAKQVNNLFTSTGKDKLTLKYCSTACRDKGTQDRVVVKCANCGKELERQRYELDVKENFFCDVNCYHEYVRKHPNASFGNNVSKLELMIRHALKVLLPDEAVEYNNRTILDGLELDIFFPKLRCGIEVNGLWHYFPIKKNRDLTLVEEHDRFKRQRSKDKDLSLYTLECRESIGMIPSEMKKLLPYIRDIVGFLNEHYSLSLTVDESMVYELQLYLYENREKLLAPSSKKWVNWEKYIKPDDLEDSTHSKIKNQ